MNLLYLRRLPLMYHSKMLVYIECHSAASSSCWYFFQFANYLIAIRTSGGGGGSIALWDLP